MPQVIPWRRHILSLLLLPVPLFAQRTTTIRSLGTTAEDRARIAQLGGASTDGSLLRHGDDLETLGPGWRLVKPELRLTHQTQLPAPDNDGALWSGRGRNALLRGGVTVGWRRLTVTLVPEVLHSANRPFEARSAAVAGWSPMASPWRTTDAPADLPVRFGDQPLTAVLTGQSSVSLRLPSITVSMTSGNLWWGPGIRNALVLGDNAAGIPRLSLRTTTPRTTVVGRIEGDWFIGGLTESRYFDQDPSNDLRGISGLAITLAPRGVDGLTVGAGRLVISSVRNANAIAGHALDAITTWNGEATRDQMTTAFFRWVRPTGRAEVWGEVAYQRLPDTPREALTAPNADMGWTAGAQWALPRPGGVLRIQSEFSDVAQSRVWTDRPPHDWGTGRRVPQGFTNRGQLLGPATGPGSTHGWIAIDRLYEAWSIGAFAARTRWENDAYYRTGILSFFAHDVSLIGGIRGEWRTAGTDLEMRLGWERRFNYQFENGTITPNNRGQRTYDNLRWSLAVTPR